MPDLCNFCSFDLIVEELADDDVVGQALKTVRELIGEYLEDYLDDLPFYAAYKVELVKKRPGGGGGGGGNGGGSRDGTGGNGNASRGNKRIQKAIRFTILFEGSDEDLLEHFGLPFGLMQAVEGGGLSFDMTPNITTILSQEKRRRGSTLQQQAMHLGGGGGKAAAAAAHQQGPQLVLNDAFKLRGQLSASFNKAISAYLARSLTSSTLHTVREADASVLDVGAKGGVWDDLGPVSSGVGWRRTLCSTC